MCAVRYRQPEACQSAGPAAASGSDLWGEHDLLRQRHNLRVVISDRHARHPEFWEAGNTRLDARAALHAMRVLLEPETYGRLWEEYKTAQLNSMTQREQQEAGVQPNQHDNIKPAGIEWLRTPASS